MLTEGSQKSQVKQIKNTTPPLPPPAPMKIREELNNYCRTCCKLFKILINKK